MTTPHKEGLEYRPDELRLLDKRVAELKDEYPRFHIMSMAATYVGNVSRCENCDKTLWPPEPIGTKSCYSPKYYSTNIADAWELFEEMKDYDPCVEYQDGRLFCSFSKSKDDSLNREIVWQETAPEAIVRAWIKWKESCTSES